MRVRWMLMGMLAGGAAWAAPQLPPPGDTEPPAAASPGQPPPDEPPRPMDERMPVAGQAARQEPVIEPEADAALRRMSAYLGGLRSFRVDTTTVDEMVTTDGQKIQSLKETKVALQRPGKLMAERRGPAGHAILRYDGKQISVHSPELQAYAVEPAPADLESAIDFAHDRLQIDAPAGDLLLPDTYHALIDGVTVGRYIGREPIAGGYAHHLAMTEKDVDWEIWIKDGPDPVPLRYVITTKDLPGQPRFTAELHDWKPNAQISEEQFTFKPPADARRMTFPELLKLKTKQRQ